MATVINLEKHTITFVGGNQPSVIVPFEKVETLAVEEVANFGKKMGKVYYQREDGATAWVAIASPEKALPDKMASLAKILTKVTGKEYPIGGI